MGDRLLVVGASGTLGREVVRELKTRGEWVRGTSRDASRVPPEVDEAVAADLLVPASLRAACADVDALVMAAGASPVSLSFRLDRRGFAGADTVGTQNLVRAAEEAGVRRAVYVSVAGPPEMDRLGYVAAHREAEEAFRQSGVETVVVRPTGFFAAFAAYLPLARMGVMPVLGRDARTNPIHEADLAAAVADVLSHEEGIIEVGGPERLSREAIARLAFAAVGKTPRFVPVPPGLARFNAGLLGLADRRLAEVVRFVAAIHERDIVAPSVGARRLGPYLEAVARGGGR